MDNTHTMKTQEARTILHQNNGTLFRQTHLLTVCMLGFLLLATSPSHALVLTYTNVYSNTLTATGATTGSDVDSVLTNNYNAFDSSLGTLEDIKIKIYGDVIVSGAPGTSLINQGLGGIVPLPYILDTKFGLNIGGLGGEYFDLGSPMELSKAITTTGTGTPIAPEINSFLFSFDYNDILSMFIGPSDVSCSGGCTSFSPPITMSGNLDSFISDNILFDQLLLSYDFSFMAVGQASSDPSVLVANSVVFIDTTYTYSAPIAEAVPEPPIALLLCSGLIALALRHYGE